MTAENRPTARLDVSALVARARRAEGPDGRLPLGDVTTWEIFPFETDGLRLRPLADPVTEPPRGGEDAATCPICQAPDDAYVWTDTRWRLRTPETATVPYLMLEPRDHVDLGSLDDDMAAELGRLVVRVERALAAIPGVGRVHVHRWGDGLAHLHVFFFARPAGLPQLHGLTMPIWANHLTPLPDEERTAIVDAVVRALRHAEGEDLRQRGMGSAPSAL